MLRNPTLLGWKMHKGKPVRDDEGNPIMSRMYKNQQEGRSPLYKCNSHARGELCEQPANVRADGVDDYVTAEFLRLVGSVQTTHVVTVPGYDPEPELRATVAEYAEHQE